MFTTHIERAQDILPEISNLFPKHHLDLGNVKDRMPLDPNYQEYLMAEQLGQLLLITLREEGVLVGYYVGFIKGGLHYKSTLTNTLDIFYVLPEKRKQNAGTILFDAVESESKRRGVRYWRVGSKVHEDHTEFFLKRGFEVIEKHCALWLGD